jgi:hypothetical protein
VKGRGSQPDRAGGARGRGGWRVRWPGDAGTAAARGPSRCAACRQGMGVVCDWQSIRVTCAAGLDPETALQHARIQVCHEVRSAAAAVRGRRWH